MIEISGECIHSRCYNDEIYNRYCFNHLDLDMVIRNALEDEANVEIQLDDEYGYNIVIDGVTIIDYDGPHRGLPYEMFGGQFGQKKLTEKAQEKIQDVVENADSTKGGGSRGNND